MIGPERFDVEENRICDGKSRLIKTILLQIEINQLDQLPIATGLAAVTCSQRFFCLLPHLHSIAFTSKTQMQNGQRCQCKTDLESALRGNFLVKAKCSRHQFQSLRNLSFLIIKPGKKVE